MLKRVSLAALLCGVTAASSADGLSAWAAQIDSVMGAIRVATKQTSASKDKDLVVRSQATQASSSAALDIYNREQVRQTIASFGPTGQLVDPCYQLSMANMGATTKGKTDSAALQDASLVYSVGLTGSSSAGGIAGAFGATKQVVGIPYAASVLDRSNRHLSRYCSVAESSLGLCQLNANGMQAGDSDFSLHLQPGKTYGWDQVEAATDFVKTMAPLAATDADTSCASIECRSERAEQRKREASLSMSRYSMLRFVEAHSTQLVGDAKQPVVSQ